jgi:DNA-binding transcriptional LysR family regulator
MELYQLRTFKMVAEEGHLTRAAKRLHASQPAISAHIKTLEEELGVTLFQRMPKGMILTAEGIKLKEHADKALAIVEEMVSQAGKLRETLNGDLRVGINAGADSLRIPEFFSVMKTRHPNLNMHLLQCMTGEVLNKLESGGLDAGFMYGENSSEKIIAVELKKLSLVIAGPIAWREQLMAAQPDELDRFPWIMTPADCPFYNVASQLFKTYGLLPAQVVLADQEATIKSMIKAGTGISLLLEQDVRQEEIDGSMTIWRKEQFLLNLSIACLKRRKDEPVLQTFLSALSEVWSD